MNITNIASAWSTQRRRDGALAVAIGIDTLMALEDLLGDSVAVAVALQTAARIEPLLPEGASLEGTSRGRMLVMLPDMARPAVEHLVQTLQRAVAETPIPTPVGNVGVTISAGAVRGGLDGNRDVTTAALAALRRAQSDGPGAFAFADDPVALMARNDAVRAATIGASAAIGEGRLTLAYQPVVRALGGNAVGFHECLIRLTGPDGQTRSAGSFMPAVEALGLASMIDRQALILVAETLAANPAVRLSVNVAPASIADAGWMEIFTERFARNPDLAERVIVEITESGALLDHDRTSRFLETIRATGASIAIDDFGAGATSLSYLRDFRFDMMKIDGSYIEGILEKPDNQFLVRSMVSIARHFEMMTVAEYVQGPTEARMLMELGIEFFQGFYYGAPSLVLDPAPEPARPVLIAV